MLLNRRLIKLARTTPGSAYKYALTFEVTALNPCTGFSMPTESLQTVLANRVVLALPRAALEALRAPDDNILFGRNGAFLNGNFTAVTTGDCIKSEL